MSNKHDSHRAIVSDIGRKIAIAYDSRTRIPRPTSMAPMFDATRPGFKTTYRPPASPTHYVDDAIAAASRAARKSIRAGNRLHARIQARAVSQGVRLVNPLTGQTVEPTKIVQTQDGPQIKALPAVLMDAKHGAIVRATVTRAVRKPYAKTVPMSGEAMRRARDVRAADLPGTFYPASAGPKPCGKDLDADPIVTARLVQTPARPTAPTLAERLAKFRGPK
jgi:hypothetical protein